MRCGRNSAAACALTSRSGTGTGEYEAGHGPVIRGKRSYGIKEVASWNAWREGDEDIRPDLIRANLAKADLRGADLRGASLNAADLGEVDLSGANLERANLTGANLHGMDLRQTFVRDCRL
jgi:Pentapeptide repeats (8 copies)